MPNAYAQIAFTPHVRAEQKRKGSDKVYDQVLASGNEDGIELTAREAAFLAARDSIFLATVSETGWPYVQHRGGPAGFLKIIDAQTIGFADYRGNRQYISTGNMTQNPRISIIALDYARRERLKILGYAQITEEPEIIDILHGQERPRAERAFIIRVAAYDWNCPQHIPIRRTDAEFGDEIARLLGRIEELELDAAKARAATKET